RLPAGKNGEPAPASCAAGSSPPKSAGRDFLESSHFGPEYYASAKKGASSDAAFCGKHARKHNGHRNRRPKRRDIARGQYFGERHDYWSVYRSKWAIRINSAFS